MALILLALAGCRPAGSTPIHVVDGLTGRPVQSVDLAIAHDDVACATNATTDEEGDADLLPGCDAPWTLSADGWTFPEAIDAADDRVVVHAWRTPGAGAWALDGDAPTPLPSPVAIDHFTRPDGTLALMPVMLPGAIPALSRSGHLFLGEGALVDALVPLGPSQELLVQTLAGARTIPAWRWLDPQRATPPTRVERSPVRHVRLDGLSPGTWALTDASRTRAQLFEVREGT